MMLEYSTSNPAVAGLRCIAAGLALLVGSMGGVRHCIANDAWGGSVGFTSDYLVRGITRSNDRAALQIDLHYLNSSGFVAGLFASNSQFDPGDRRDVELNAFLGFGWKAGNDWRGRIFAVHYSYPWNQSGSQYNYDELNLDLGYQEWLNVSLAYSPNSPHTLPYGEYRHAMAKSAELNLQRPILRKLLGTAGVGYYYLAGPEANGYAYWSLGLAYDFAPLSLTVAYVDTTGSAKLLFYNAFVSRRWLATLIWRF